MDTQKNLYYQINYRTYPVGTPVESLTAALLVASGDEIQRTNETLRDQREISGDHRESGLVRGSSGEDEGPDLHGPGQITSLQVQVKSEDLPNALRNTILEISFDGQSTVWCPLGDFFGSGIGLNPYRSWYTEVRSDGTLLSFWPMPFRENASVRFYYLGSQPTEIEYELSWRDSAWTPDSLYFHCDWKQERGMETVQGNGTRDWNYLQVEGTGVYVGDTLSILNPAEAWWGEGDEKIYVDGEKFPSHFGTGSEDYYGYAWGCPDFFNAPFHAQPRVEGPGSFGRTTNLRFRALDAIPFQTAFRFDMEIFHWAQVKVDYAVAAYWYGSDGSESVHQPTRSEREAEAAVPVSFHTPRIISLRNMTIVEPTCGPVEIQDMKSFTHENQNWPDDNQILWRPLDPPGAGLAIRVQTDRENVEKITLGLTLAPDYGIFRISLDGKELLSRCDLYSSQGVSRDTFVLDAPAGLTPGEHVLTFEKVGQNEKSSGSLFGIDTIHFE